MSHPTRPRSRVLRLAAAGLLLCAVPPAFADLYVVLNAANTARPSRKEILELYTGRTRQFSGGEFALVLDMPRDSTERGRFYQSLAGMGLSQVNSYWSRLMFSGQTSPPQQMPSETAVGDVVRQNRGAIGYLTREPADKSLVVIFVLKE